MATKSASFIDFFAKDYRRAIVIGVMLVVIIILLVVFWGRIKDIFKQIQAKLSNKTLQNEWTAQTGELPQLTRAQLAVYVSQLKQAGPDVWGTDEDVFYNVFNAMRNTADVYALITEYGTYEGKTLDAMVRSELTSGELKKVNKILSDKNIAYQF